MNTTFLSILPEVSLAVFSFILLALGLVRSEKLQSNLGWVTAIGLTGILAATIIFYPIPSQASLLWGGMLREDSAAYLFRLLFLAAAALTALFVKTDECLSVRSEFYFLLVTSTLGMTLLSASADLIMLFLSVEITSIPLYVLAGSKLRFEGSVEAGIKYFLFGAMSSAFLIYGLSLLYGTIGTTQLYASDVALKLAAAPRAILLVIAVFVLGGFAFKISAVPFHFWTPDVYEGAPSSVGGFLSTASKAAGFVALIRILSALVGFQLGSVWMILLMVMAVSSMFIGNLVAIQQKNLKRMIAYSSIAQAGYILVGVIAGGADGISGAAYYLLAYLLTNLLVFAIIGRVIQQTGSSDFSAFAGLNRRAPGLALMLLVGLLSLGGIPPFAGFFAKVLVFGSAMSAGLAWLVIVGVINSIIGLYYYLRVLKVMYLDEPVGEWKETPLPWGWALGAGVCLLGVIILGVYLSPWFNWATLAAAGF
jgi:NADH-quinone oxidoreductase subunit N